MAKYSISFDYGAMQFPDEELPAVAEAAHAVVREAKAAGVWVFGGGLAEPDTTRVVTADGSVTALPPVRKTQHLAGITIVDVRSEAEAMEWAARIAAACRCPQEVRAVMDDPESGPGFTGDLRGISITDANLSGARIMRADLSGLVMRGVDVSGVEVDSPWLLEGGARFTVNGVDVTAFVDAELDRRFPGRQLRCATDPDGLRAAWRALETAWAATVARAEAMPAGSVDRSVAEEWSFAQTLRHLVMATDTWLGKAIQQVPQPYHPAGLPHAEFAADGGDLSAFKPEQSWDDVLAARADRQTMVRDFLRTATVELLAEERPNPHAPAYSETVLSCLRTILEEEWEHHRYAVRDLDALDSPDAVRPTA